MRKNSEGYADPTAWAAINKVDGVADKAWRVCEIIFKVAKLGGFKVKGDLTLIDRNGDEHKASELKARRQPSIFKEEGKE